MTGSISKLSGLLWTGLQSTCGEVSIAAFCQPWRRCFACTTNRECELTWCSYRFGYRFTCWQECEIYKFALESSQWTSMCWWSFWSNFYFAGRPGAAIYQSESNWWGATPGSHGRKYFAVVVFSLQLLDKNSLAVTLSEDGSGAWFAWLVVIDQKSDVWVFFQWAVRTSWGISRIMRDYQSGILNCENAAW